MIFTREELKEAICNKNIEKYMEIRGYRYLTIGSKDKPLYLIESKLNLKPKVEIETVLQKEYNIQSDILDDAVDIIIGVYESEESINIEELVKRDKNLIGKLLQEDILRYDFRTYEVSCMYSLLTKILVV